MFAFLPFLDNHSPSINQIVNLSVFIIDECGLALGLLLFAEPNQKQIVINSNYAFLYFVFVVLDGQNAVALVVDVQSMLNVIHVGC